MVISARLKQISEMVRYKTLADIGTDHAYLPIYLCKNSIIDNAIACDVNKAPLNRAINNIKIYNLSGNIKTHLGSGLEGIREGEYETLVIAGMGGMLINRILSERIQVAKSFKQIILQPQHDLKEVRAFLIQNGFCIAGEEILSEDGKYYFIIECMKGESGSYSESELFFGKFLLQKKDSDNTLFKEYITNETENTILLIKKLTNNKQVEDLPENITLRLKQLNFYLSLCSEVLKCL